MMSSCLRTHMVAILALVVSVPTLLCAQEPDRGPVFEKLVEHGEGTWRKANNLDPGLSSRDLFSYALALCEADAHPDRLARLFEVAARMQDRDEQSRGYGNFRWRWSEGAVLDYNAVEFAMQSGALIWLRHREKLAAEARETLAEILEYAVQGCLRHRVPASYTNIALMNAENLILLGEALEKPEVADEGYRRLDSICIYTWEAGIHEYDSPTYYGVDLDCLLLIEAFCERESGREQARALLELFWTDLGLNWFPPAEKLAGARSRDYDYLRGLGYLDCQMWPAGWLAEEMTPSLAAALGRWRPPERLREMSRERFPRLVRQSWGLGINESRTHCLLPDVTLSSSGANYGPMDLPLTVDLPGDRSSVRCYFIPDARRDPYGKKKIPAGPHEKTLHLRPFFAAAQRTVDALGLVVYRESDLPDNPATLESHFVMPRDVDSIWLGDREVHVEEGTPLVVPLQRDEGLVLRKGTAAVGLRVLWARGLDGGDAPAALVHDANRHGAMRLTVAHHSFWGGEESATNAGAALWVRIGGGLQTDEEFEAWREEFATAEARVSASADEIDLTARGQDGPVALSVAAPYVGCLNVEPPPTRAILELDGEDIGKPILQGLEVVRAYEARRAHTPSLVAALQDGVYLEAEAGLVMSPMVIGKDPKASGGEYVWMPGEPGAKGGGHGSVTWRFKVDKPGAYYIWGRIVAPTPDDDSFFVRVFTETSEPIGRADWHAGTHEKWEWTPMALGREQQPTTVTLPKGEVSIQLRVREDGTRIDRLFVTPYMDQEPQ